MAHSIELVKDFFCQSTELFVTRVVAKVFVGAVTGVYVGAVVGAVVVGAS
ncbi:hypothetical protein C2G38_2169940 [Gigaspora rosea]|uniref:Uncharacterized protein n=1 Tax=Gigaspora rosea TaxID=44941 RepID=A0A397VN45_9GLOM|nr:hypothetical protein C2G38_2169940 [Gigaspora rosea]